MNTHFKILILGGGSGGISMAARMKKHIPASQIAVVDSSDMHFYQPFWTLIGAGVGKKEDTAKPMKDLIPSGVQWIKANATQVEPKINQVTLDNGTTLSYDFLIVATGLTMNYAPVKGLKEALGKDGVHTIYDYKDAEKTYEAINSLKSGTALFTMPPPPIKCPGAPQKIMYLADDIFRRNGVRNNVKVVWATAGAAMFGVPTYVPPLNEVVKRKGIQTHFGHKLVEIKADKKTAVFETQKDGKTEQVEIAYNFLHVIPPQKAHDFIIQSGLVHTEGPQTGWLKVDIHTLQHLDYKNIFGIGDVTGMPNSKTGAAIRACAPILEHNILSAMENKTLEQKYNGYASCPLITGFGKVILAEFGYDGKLMPTFPLDTAKEHRSYWILKRYLLPKLYWHGMMKGWL